MKIFIFMCDVCKKKSLSNEGLNILQIDRTHRLSNMDVEQHYTVNLCEECALEFTSKYLDIKESV